MNATLYLPGQTPQPVILTENTAAAAARLLGVPAAVVFNLSEHYGQQAARGWGDLHGRCLLVQQ